MTERVKLNEGDWNEIFNIELFTLGKTELPLKALVLEDLADVCALIGKAGDAVMEKMPVFEDKEKTISQKIEESIPTIAKIVANDFPEVLQKMSNLHIADIKKLPAGTQVELALKCIEINLESMESLLKNLPALMIKGRTLSQSMKNMGTSEKKAATE